MSFSSDDLARLDAAIASGVSEVTFSDGRRVRYRSLDELRTARRDVAAELSAASGTRPATYVNPTFDRGL